jgi:hypothetical protein
MTRCPAPVAFDQRRALLPTAVAHPYHSRGMNVRQPRASRLLVAALATPLVACGSTTNAETAQSIDPGTTIPAPTGTAASDVPVYTAGEIATAQCGCDAPAGSVQTYDSIPQLEGLIVGAWLRCGPAGPTGDVGYVFTADGQFRFLVKDARGQLTVALDPTTFAVDFPLVPATSVTDGGGSDGARIDYVLRASTHETDDVFGEIDVTTADRSSFITRAAFTDAPARVSFEEELYPVSPDTISSYDFTYVRIGSTLSPECAGESAGSSRSPSSAAPPRR